MAFFKSKDEWCDGPIWVPWRHVHNWSILISAYIIRPFLKLFFRYRVKGAENLPKPGEEPYVIALNHVSYVDPLLLWCVLYGRRLGCRFLGRTSLFRPVIGPFLVRSGAIPIDPDSADRTAIKRAAAALKRGENLMIFPEGTRMNKADKSYEAHAGLTLIAQMGKAKILPVGIAGTDEIRPEGSKLMHFPTCTLNVGKPIDIKDEKFDALPRKGRGQFIAQYVMQEVFALRDEAGGHAPAAHPELVPGNPELGGILAPSLESRGEAVPVEQA